MYLYFLWLLFIYVCTVYRGGVILGKGTLVHFLPPRFDRTVLLCSLVFHGGSSNPDRSAETGTRIKGLVLCIPPGNCRRTALRPTYVVSLRIIEVDTDASTNACDISSSCIRNAKIDSVTNRSSREVFDKHRDLEFDNSIVRTDGKTCSVHVNSLPTGNLPTVVKDVSSS